MDFLNNGRSESYISLLYLIIKQLMPDIQGCNISGKQRYRAEPNWFRPLNQLRRTSFVYKNNHLLILFGRNEAGGQGHAWRQNSFNGDLAPALQHRLHRQQCHIRDRAAASAYLSQRLDIRIYRPFDASFLEHINPRTRPHSNPSISPTSPSNAYASATPIPHCGCKRASSSVNSMLALHNGIRS